MNIDAHPEFTDEKVKTLNMFIAEQQKSFAENRSMFHPGYLEGFNYFFGNGFKPADFFEKLRRIGWEIRIVDGYLSGYEYFKNLNRQVLPVIRDIRPMEQICYADFPDMIHDIMGHAPMLNDPEYVAFLKQISSLVSNVEMEPMDLEYLSLHKHTAAERKLVQEELDAMEESLKKQPTLFYKINNIALWTIEFGMLGSKSPYICYGAALAGSPLEIKNIREGKANVYNLNSLSCDALFNFSDFQEQLYTTDSLEDVISYIERLKRTDDKVEQV
ncbi:hypothetical protein JMN32_25110 [Fulvivirga sp. 29W222]|uniref:Biopterin-dependent aromatic amino acid hydroxylase family profile domain-containing protein n=1 Tax=Fulvivirga marina TaxID=2494733 RepID=A0A937KGN5_9BACT|nr:hypothetical protein [Fulvivirga marina]MBL6449615.1 hypothetical protein [Fulvivirga marina]